LEIFGQDLLRFSWRFITVEVQTHPWNVRRLTPFVNERKTLMSDPKLRADLLVDGLDRIAEAERFTKLSRSLLYQLMGKGELPYVKIGRARRIPHRALLELAAKNLVTACPGVDGLPGK
jgi:excisionase family DNA binding protein